MVIICCTKMAKKTHRNIEQNSKEQQNGSKAIKMNAKPVFVIHPVCVVAGKLVTNLQKLQHSRSR